MSIKPAIFPWIASIVSVSAIAVAPLHGQNSGFQIGQNQGTPPATRQTPPMSSGSVFIAPMTSPISPTANPIAPFGGPVSPPQQPQKATIPGIIAAPGFGAISVLPAGGTVFVPTGTTVIESGPGMQPGAFLTAPSATMNPATPATPQNLERSARGTRTTPQASPSESARPALGTSRDKVIEKYGNPIAFIMNMNGETLYFRNGVIVFIRDGVVADPVVPQGVIRP